MVLFAHANPGAAYCLEGPLEYPGGFGIRYEIPVYIYDSGTTFAELPLAAVEHELKLAISHWREESGAYFRPYFAGRTTDTSAFGRIIVRDSYYTEEDCSSGQPACERTNIFFFDPFSGPVRAGSTVWFVWGPGAPYSQWTLPLIAKSMTHEIGHSFGLEDTYLGHCFNGFYDNGGVMGAGFSHQAATLGRDDRLGMQDLYGARTQSIISAYSKSEDRLNWTSEQIDSNQQPFLYPFGSESSGLPEEFIAYSRDEDPVDVVAACDYASCMGVSTWQLWVTASTENMASLANKSGKKQFVILPDGETVTDGMRHFQWYITDDSWDTISAYGVLQDQFGDIEMAFSGVTASYDPRTDRYVVAYRDPNWVINVVTIEAEEPHNQSDVSGNGETAWRTPAVECTDAEFAGSLTDTCMLVWLSGKSMHPVAYAPMTIDNGSGYAIIQSTEDTTIIGNSTPALTETRRPDVPWLMAAEQGFDIDSNNIKVFERASAGDWSSGIVAVPDQDLENGIIMSPGISMVNDGNGEAFHVRYGLPPQGP